MHGDGIYQANDVLGEACIAPVYDLVTLFALIEELPFGKLGAGWVQ
jgi:hypothetical protein